PQRKVRIIDVSAATCGRDDICIALSGSNSGSQEVEGTVYLYHHSGEVRTSGTQMIARIVQSEEWAHIGTNNVASIDSTPLTSFQTSSAIKRNHKETTDRSWFEEPTS
ncbi:hypothetical protein TNCV_699011, partial [Trichonephila clavipes]